MIDAYLSQSVHLERTVGANVYGEAAHAATVLLPARVQEKSRLVRSADGREILSDTRVYLAPGIPVAPGDRVIYGGASYRVLSVERGQGLDGETHVVAYLGRS